MNRLDELIEELSSLNERLRQLEETDYMTAYYKGYSASGLTLEEIREQMTDLRQRIAQVEQQLDDSSYN